MKTIYEVSTAHRGLLCEVLGITEQEYETMLFDTAFAYVHKLYGNDKMAQEFTKYHLFWQWWVNQWNIRSTQFIISHGLTKEYRATPSYLRYLQGEYEHLHSLENLSVRPNRHVMEETYHNAIHALIKQEVHTANA